MHLLLDTTQKQFYLEKTKAYFHLGSFHSAARHLTGYYIILTVAVNETDRWSPPLPLLWHLSEISAICSFWPQLQILWRGGGQLTWNSRAPALCCCVRCPLAIDFYQLLIDSSLSYFAPPTAETFRQCCVPHVRATEIKLFCRLRNLLILVHWISFSFI